MKFLVLMTTILLSGCLLCPPKPVPPGGGANGTSPASGTALDTVKPVEVDERLLAPCTAPHDMEERIHDGKSILAHKAHDVAVTADCAKRQSELVRLVRKYWSIPEPK